MTYKKPIHNRKSIRLRGYDYSKQGFYFITICTQNRAHLFGTINNGNMILHKSGQMVKTWYYELQNKFPDIICHEMIIMPNHFHCIIQNVGYVVGADLRVCPNYPNIDNHITKNIIKPYDHHNVEKTGPGGIQGEHIGSPLHHVVQWFKTMTTNAYIRGVKTQHWKPFDGKLWQRNYYENIISNEQSYHRISNYIIQNPQMWKGDRFFR